jgi:hypothetical protein
VLLCSREKSNLKPRCSLFDFAHLLLLVTLMWWS